MENKVSDYKDLYTDPKRISKIKGDYLKEGGRLAVMTEKIFATKQITPKKPRKVENKRKVQYCRSLETKYFVFELFKLPKRVVMNEKAFNKKSEVLDPGLPSPAEHMKAFIALLNDCVLGIPLSKEDNTSLEKFPIVEETTNAKRTLGWMIRTLRQEGLLRSRPSVNETAALPSDLEEININDSSEQLVSVNTPMPEDQPKKRIRGEGSFEMNPSPSTSSCASWPDTNEIASSNTSSGLSSDLGNSEDDFIALTLNWWDD